jgi:hypothetical protein
MKKCAHVSADGVLALENEADSRKRILSRIA